MNYQIIDGGVTAPKGFQAASAAAKIKKNGQKDMALLYSCTPCKAAGTFTTNIVKAAPVKWDHELVRQQPHAQAVVCNSGVANACTGQEGMNACRETAREAGKLLNIPETSVLVASTGVIGQQIPIEQIKEGLPLLVKELSDSREAATQAAQAIMTTDTVKKEAAVSFSLEGTPVHIGGMCKGSGMIHPNMCTMLSFITTDANISKELLQKALSQTVADTYNMVSVDGDTSTNDTVLLLANGLAGNPEITEENQNYQDFLEALRYVNETLAKSIAADGEGCTALLETKIIGASQKSQARTLAKSIISSNLTKAAIYGHDANWGRILCAMGYSGAEFDPEKVDLFIESAAGKLQLMKDGTAAAYSEDVATVILSEKTVTITADLKMGSQQATAWGCDLTHEYININADYRS
ncbi:MAG: bifunctional glutamate N-acetyltransferase/amino-acid acetyltransferase ArgJ [Lachnospiraceae bacterium]|nr:bifunctional glutamate N-acetyltransferase/amino-acid acetyltransferase ArgJ [Lachnospiraceae bacterium]